MATPYWQMRREEVPSTQDLALEALERLPVVVIAASQSKGRGRTGVEWFNAPRALAVSVAMSRDENDSRPLSLMAGIAARRALDHEVQLKWPNDLLWREDKVGGILVEQVDGSLVIGLGLNLWWPDAPEGVSALFDADPGPGRHQEIGAMWAAEMLALVGEPGWPRDEYRTGCSTLGRDIAWDPGGSGRAVDVAETGALIVDTGAESIEIHSGAVRHVRG